MDRILGQLELFLGNGKPEMGMIQPVEECVIQAQAKD
jgi:hypothetical protein